MNILFKKLLRVENKITRDSKSVFCNDVFGRKFSVLIYCFKKWKSPVHSVICRTFFRIIILHV